MSEDTKIVNGIDGREFLIRVVRQGDRYGLDDCLIHEDARPMIEVYDHSADKESFGERGQFTGGRYYASTLAEHEPGHPLCLDMGIPAWTLTAEAADAAAAMAQEAIR